MPTKPPTFRPGGKTPVDTKRERDRLYDRRRAKEGAIWRPWYNTTHWRTIRAIVLTRDPACIRCLARGVVSVSTVADHIDSTRKGDRSYFFAPTSCQGLCATCHNSEKQREERARPPT